MARATRWGVACRRRAGAGEDAAAPDACLVARRGAARRGGELAVLAPETTTFTEDEAVAAHEISSTAHVVDGQHVFQLAWVRDDGTVADSWLLAEQLPRSQRGDGGAAASNIVAAFRAARGPRE